jgi:hypothetical protein
LAAVPTPGRVPVEWSRTPPELDLHLVTRHTEGRTAGPTSAVDLADELGWPRRQGRRVPWSRLPAELSRETALIDPIDGWIASLGLRIDDNHFHRAAALRADLASVQSCPEGDLNPHAR